MNQIKIEDLQRFLETEKVTFAETSTKKLVVSVGYSNYEVFHKKHPDSPLWHLVHIGVQPYPAVEAYNNL